MRAGNAYPLVTVDALADCCDFYVRSFGMEVVFEARWVVMLSLPGKDGISLGLMSPDHPTSPPGPEKFSGAGMIVTVEVEDAAKALAELTKLGAPIRYGLHDEPWGQRRFMTADPSGTLIDIVEQIAPAEGYWEKYAVV